MNTTILQGNQTGNPFAYSNTIYVIDDYVIINPDNALPIQIASNCILRFTGAGDPDVNNNGRGLLRGSTPIKLVGNNTRIEAGDYHILDDNIDLGGSFLNAEWPVEWWGAKSDGTDAAPAINRALEQIGGTDKQGTLLLADRYEVRDTIYMQPGVAISGVSSTYSHKYYNTQTDSRGTLVVNFVDGNNAYVRDKWVIDTPYVNGQGILWNQLFIDVNQANSESLVFAEYTGCNISNLHIVDKSATPPGVVFGGIRIHSMQAATIRNVDIEAHTFIGLALAGKVWFTSIDNVFIRACGCGLYIGNECTMLSSHNLSVRCWHDYYLAETYYRLALPDQGADSLVAPMLQENTLPPYWDAGKMRSCGIIMERKSHCTFLSAAVELFDAVICGTDYNAKFISPYIEKINYFFAWLYSSTEYSIPSHRHELIVEDVVVGYETFPSMKKANNNYQYLDWVDYDPLQQPNAGGSQPAQGAPAIDPEGDSEPVEVQRTVGYYRFLPTFGTVRGVIKAHNVGRATCWTNEDSIFEQDKDGNWHLVTWAYPSYFIYVTPGIRQRNFYYDKYKVMVEKMTVVGTNELLSKITWLEDMDYCRYKRIIIEGSPNEPVRYYYDETNDAVYDVTEDNKAEMDIYKRALQLGVSGSDVVLCGELFERKLDNFIMTPYYGRSCIDYGDLQNENGKMVHHKRFCVEVINGANVIHFKKPLRLHDCEVTFRNSYGSAWLNNDSLDYLLGVSGHCILNFEGDFSAWGNSFGKLVKLCGDKHVKLTVRLINTSSSFNNIFAYNSSSSRYDFIVNSGVDESGSEPVPEFGPGFDVEVETYVDN